MPGFPRKGGAAATDLTALLYRSEKVRHQEEVRVNARNLGGPTVFRVSGPVYAPLERAPADAFDESPLWKRIAKRVGKAWLEGMLMTDPVAYSHYLIAKAEAEAELAAASGAAPQSPAPAVRTPALRDVARSPEYRMLELASRTSLSIVSARQQCEISEEDVHLGDPRDCASSTSVVAASSS